MSRSGYIDCIENWDLIRWRGAVTSATRGKRGQKFFRDLLAALDAMPEKVLIAEELEKDGDVCAIGSLMRARRIDMSMLDPEESETIANAVGIATCLAKEVVYVNDEGQLWGGETPNERWERMRDWVAKQIKAEG